MASREPKESRINVRVPGNLVRRVDALIPRARSISELALLGSIDRSKIARVAMLRGVAVLERETKLKGGRNA